MKLEFSDQDVIVIADALMDQPYKKVAKILADLQQQINNQQRKKSGVRNGTNVVPAKRSTE